MVAQQAVLRRLATRLGMYSAQCHNVCLSWITLCSRLRKWRMEQRLTVLDSVRQISESSTSCHVVLLAGTETTLVGDWLAWRQDRLTSSRPLMDMHRGSPRLLTQNWVKAQTSHKTDLHRVPKKTKQICFCQNFVKFAPILIIFGRKMGNNPNICEMHSFSTSPNLRHHLTVLNANVPNCYITPKLLVIDCSHWRPQLNRGRRTFRDHSNFRQFVHIW